MDMGLFFNIIQIKKGLVGPRSRIYAATWEPSLGTGAEMFSALARASNSLLVGFCFAVQMSMTCCSDVPIFCAMAA